MKAIYFLFLAQTAFALSRPEVEIPRVVTPPRIEEFLDEHSLQRKDFREVSGFRQRERNDNQPSTRQTKVFLGYDALHFYAVFICPEPNTQNIRARMMNRGNNAVYNDDIVTVQLDTFNDQRRAYQFVSNAFGVQQDAIWFENSGSFDYSFDTVFETAGKITSFGYVVLFSIPFRSLRFSSDSAQTWGILLTRYIPGADEQTYWPQYSNQIAGRLNQAARARGLRDISPGRNIQVNPYSAFRSYRALDLRESLQPRFVEDRAETQAGIDSKFVVRDSVVIDLTGNPDFSHVESDEPQITVNQRFEVLFPEKRPFFLENQSYFETPINLLFTRRIADPQFGGRMTGKIGSYNLGVLMTDDQSQGKSFPESHPLAGERAYNTAIRLSRDLGNQSSVGFLYTQRQFSESFNRVGGVDGHFKINDHWTATLQAVTSSTKFQDDSTRKGPAYRANLLRSGSSFLYNFSFNDFAEGFVTLSGFVNRTNIRQLDQQASYTFRPETKVLYAWTPHYDVSYIYDRDGTLVDWHHNPWISFDLPGQTFVGFGYTSLATRLLPGDHLNLKENLRIPHHQWNITFSSEALKRLSIAASTTFGTSINFVPALQQIPAAANHLEASLTLGFRPTNFLTIDNTYILNKLTDPDSTWRVFDNQILRSKWNYQINRQLSVRVILQYDDLRANQNFTRLQTAKNFNADLLVTYLLHPGTALFIGYNSNLQNLDPNLRVTELGLLRSRHFLNDSKQFFAKYSHLIRF